MSRNLELREAGNGGWIVFDHAMTRDPGLIPLPVAAYSTTADMIKGLQEMLSPMTPVAKYEPGGITWRSDVDA